VREVRVPDCAGAVTRPGYPDARGMFGLGDGGQTVCSFFVPFLL